MDTPEKNDKIRRTLFNEISLILAICGVALSAFVYLTGPQNSANTAIEILKQQQDAQNDQIDGLITGYKNDLHAVQMKEDSLAAQIAALTIQVAKLETVIDERIPKKTTP